MGNWVSILDQAPVAVLELGSQLPQWKTVVYWQLSLLPRELWASAQSLQNSVSTFSFSFCAHWYSKSIEVSVYCISTIYPELIILFMEPELAKPTFQNIKLFLFITVVYSKSKKRPCY